MTLFNFRIPRFIIFSWFKKETIEFIENKGIRKLRPP